MSIKAKNKIEKSDEELLRLCHDSSSQDALIELFARYIPLVYGLCLKYLRNQQSSEDAVLKIFDEIKQKCLGHEIVDFKDSVYSTAKEYCLNVISVSNPKYYKELNDGQIETQAFIYLLKEDMQSKEKSEALRICLDKLPKEQLKCVKSFFFEESSLADIVLMTGYSQSKVKEYIQNGKDSIKACMLKTMNL